MNFVINRLGFDSKVSYVLKSFSKGSKSSEKLMLNLRNSFFKYYFKSLSLNKELLIKDPIFTLSSDFGHH